MKKKPVTLSPRAALFIGAALLATPAFAQDAPTQTVTPPPVVSTTPATPAPAPAAPARVIQFDPATPQVQTVPATPEPATAEPRARTTSTTTRTQTRTQPRPTVTRQTTRTTAPAAPAPEAAAPPATPVETTPPVEAIAPPPETVAPVAETTETTTQTSEAATTQTALWPWIAGGALIVLAALAFLFMRRRREEEEEVYYEPYVASETAGDPELIAAREAREEYREEIGLAESIPAAIPLAAELPETIEDAEIVRADADDLAGLTAAAPVAKRPWLEFGMRPVRAGTSLDEALVDIELTVANAGDIDAKDVRISTFLLSETEASEMENMLLDRPESSVPPVTIPAGRGTRVDATLALRKDGLDEKFTPVVVADARYTMADGSEGRTSATFRVGLWNEGEGLEPIDTRDREMHHNVAAELHGVPAHA
ncbi:hypothetical protein P1X14_16795 [Sphingomonas sp. AOB5]|uniref:hypothetical protein n=1 Tax=Sphingomonas sp. AOB5 TaxID=3034017 RepID=UPI0023F7CF67|nr:hypothetical protein [Sphingomonas sp. AOB5]MDF7776918.1 hypothetical protein [Sphingomonas sp. AOB5]